MLIVSWLIYIFISFYFREYSSKFILYFIVGLASLIAKYPLAMLNVEYNPYIIYFASLFLGGINQKTKYLPTIIITYYGFLVASSLYNDFITPHIQTAMSILPMFYFAVAQPTTRSRFYISLYIVSLIIANFSNSVVFELLNILVPLYLLTEKISKTLEKKDEELEKFKLKLRKNIEMEVQKEIERLEIKLQIAYKKLKEIFKLNSYTIKEITIEEIAERVVKGLVDLGYTGAVLEIKKYSVIKKEGFFPNLKTYIDEVFRSTENTTEAEDNKILIIPLNVESERLGTLAVYSKNEINGEEIDYLITYAKSIATSIAKIDYFTQLIKLRDLIYTAVDSINIPLAVTNIKFEIEIANEAFLKLVGKEHLNHENVFNVLPMLDKISKDIQTIFQTRTSTQQTVNLTEKQVERFFEIKVYPVISDDKVESLVFIVEDITEKREMEKQILHSEKLAVIGRLTAGISHEIKNPLAIISQSAFSLKRKISKSCEKESISNMNELIERIEKSTDRAKDIIDRLLNFSKPYYNKIEIVNVKEVLQEAVKLSILQTKKNDIKIHSYLKDAYIRGDRNSLIQLFINIIINSIEAIASTGKITIKTFLDKKNNHVKVVIKDTGHGIPPEILDKIFEPFFTTKDKGTGLGLSVSYKIVKDHGGEIFVKSEEGQGAEFTITFPTVEV